MARSHCTCLGLTGTTWPCLPTLSRHTWVVHLNPLGPPECIRPCLSAQKKLAYTPLHLVNSACPTLQDTLATWLTLRHGPKQTNSATQTCMTPPPQNAPPTRLPDLVHLVSLGNGCQTSALDTFCFTLHSQRGGSHILHQGIPSPAPCKALSSSRTLSAPYTSLHFRYISGSALAPTG